jgi:hypothetical protein
VKGSHGRPADRPEDGPLQMTSDASLLPTGNDPIAPTDVFQTILRHLTD